MRKITLALLFLSCMSLVLALIAHPQLVTSQLVGSDSQFNRVVQDVQKTDSSGATPDEMRGLVTQLNTVIQLQNELDSLPPQDTDKRAQALEQINRTLTSIDGEAIRIAVNASERTSLNHLVAYSSGIAAAVLGTIVYYYGTLLWRKYRIKRIMGMRITLRER
jgi:methyl-accepting chemotaxis protein